MQSQKLQNDSPEQSNCIITAELKFKTIFLKFGKLASNYITKLYIYARNNYKIFENFETMLGYITFPMCTGQWSPTLFTFYSSHSIQRYRGHPSLKGTPSILTTYFVPFLSISSKRIHQNLVAVVLEKTNE